MTSQPEFLVTRALRRAVAAARLAPSVHNTQPWHFTLTGTTLRLQAENSRRLQVLDATGRQLALSCGCALFNARVALAAADVATRITRWPADDPALPARLVAVGADHGATAVDRGIAHLDHAVPLRQTNRRRFGDEPVPTEVIDALVAAAAAERCTLVPVIREDDRRAVARLTQEADGVELADPAYRAELRAWTSDDPARLDGVPARSVPHVDRRSGDPLPAADDVPLRDFDTRGTGWLPTLTGAVPPWGLLVLTTPADDRASWLRAGEALERVWLEATRLGFAMSLFTQVVEVTDTRTRLAKELALTGEPQVLMRIGRATVTASSARRRLGDILTVL